VIYKQIHLIKRLPKNRSVNPTVAKDLLEGPGGDADEDL